MLCAEASIHSFTGTNAPRTTICPQPSQKGSCIHRPSPDTHPLQTLGPLPVQSPPILIAYLLCMHQTRPFCNPSTPSALPSPPTCPLPILALDPSSTYTNLCDGNGAASCAPLFACAYLQERYACPNNTSSSLLSAAPRAASSDGSSSRATHTLISSSLTNCPWQNSSAFACILRR